MFDEIKRKQTKIIEDYYGSRVSLYKLEIVNILDTQLSLLPELDLQRYIIYLKSAEHPDGYKIGLEARPVLRLKGLESDFAIVRDSGNNPDSYFWDEATYAKMKKKSKNYFIGTQTGQYLEAYYNLRRKLNGIDGRLLANKIAANKNPLEVVETPSERREGYVVTKELVKLLDGKLLESYNDWDANETSPLNEGDLLVYDNGYYYRVEASLAKETYDWTGKN